MRCLFKDSKIVSVKCVCGSLSPSMLQTCAAKTDRNATDVFCMICCRVVHRCRVVYRYLRLQILAYSVRVYHKTLCLAMFLQEIYLKRRRWGWALPLTSTRGRDWASHIYRTSAVGRCECDAYLGQLLLNLWCWFELLHFTLLLIIF